MRTPTRFSLTWAYVAGALTVATGLLHDAMIYTQLEVFESLPRADRYGSMWLFLCTGTAVVFAGALNLAAVRGLVRGESWAHRLTLASCLFLALLGVVGLLLSQWGASSLVALAVISLVPWWLTRRATVASPLGHYPLAEGSRDRPGASPGADEPVPGGAA